MKVAHFAQFAPNRAGQYGTAKDLILAERALGIDAQLIDSALPCKSCGHYDHKVGVKDGEVETQPLAWAYQADLLVRHTCIPAELESSGIPMILCMHGRPENTFILECLGRMPVFSFMEQVPYDLRYKAYITFWEEFVPIWSMMMPSDKLEYVPAPVNMDEFKPDGTKFSFGDRAGAPNLLVTDMWREDVTPFNILMAAAVFKQTYCPEAKVHVFGLPTTGEGPVAVLARSLEKTGVWGSAFTLHDQMADIYRAADILLTPHVIATRVIREACASGLPIIADNGCPYTSFTANPRDIQGFAQTINQVWLKIQNGSIYNHLNSRQIAAEHFNMKKAGEAMVRIFEKVLNKYALKPVKGAQRKVFVDIGGHLGESITKFYTDVDNAAEYQIFSFEPYSEAFAQLTQNTCRLKNCQLLNQAVGIEDAIVDLYPGHSHLGEGSTLLPGKKTGAVEYSQPTKVELIDFVRWFNENIYPTDQVVVKMNIEGGEYPLVLHMLKHQLLARISVLYVQWHADKFENPDAYRFVEAQLEEEAKKYPDCAIVTNRKGVFSFRNLNHGG